MKTPLALLPLCLMLLNISCPREVPNADDCTNDENICTEIGLVCDKDLHECATPKGCVNAASCISPGAAVCEDSQCVPCSTGMQCDAWSTAHNATPSRQHCVQIGNQNTCVECRRNMDAADCKDADNPVCDGTLNLCRPCRADAECFSGICRKVGDYPETAPIATLKTGQCVPVDQVSYVNQDDPKCATGGGGGTPGMPYCMLDAAFNAGKPYIFVSANTNMTKYPIITMNAQGKTFVVVGSTVDSRSFVSLDHVDVNNGTLVLSSLYILPTVNATAPAVTCNSKTAKLYIQNSTISTMMGGRGVDASGDCGQLTLDRVAINCGNVKKFGILIGGTGGNPTNYRIVNTSVVNCGGAGGDLYGIQFNGGATGYFAFNTISRNYYGINCQGSTQTIVNSIVAGNMMSQIDNCTYDPKVNITDSMMIDPASLLPYLRVNSPKNDNNVVDKAQPPPPNQDVVVDTDGLPRPRGKGYDIGFQELK